MPDKSMVGRKFILWHGSFAPKDDAYHDQFGIAHPGYTILEEIPVVVTLDTTEAGERILTATHTDGRVFRACWTANGWWWAIQENGADLLWRPVDACKAYNKEVMYPYVGPDEKPVFPTGAQKCETHNQAYMDDDPYGCFKCYLDRLPVKETVASAT